MTRKNVFIGVCLMLSVWSCVAYSLGSTLLPYPSDVGLSLFKGVLYDGLIGHLLYSLYRLVVALLLSFLMGTGLGIFMGMNRWVEAIVNPLLMVLFPIPKTALLPVLFLIFGLGDGSKIALLWLILFFQLLMAVYKAVNGINPTIFLSAKTLSIEGWALYRHVVFPAILPDLLTALRISVGTGVAVLFFVENYATDRGLGYYIMNHWALLNYSKMYGGIVLLSLMGVFLFKGIDVLQDRMVKW